MTIAKLFIIGAPVRDLARHSRPTTSFVVEPFSFAPGLSLQSTTDPSDRCSCMLQCNSAASLGFFAVNGSATYLFGGTSTCHVIAVMRSPVVFVVKLPTDDLVTSVTMTPSGTSRSID